jgi:LAGLIDADG endonuclease
MSLWAATVITNLLSSIPVFGQDLVESNIFENCCLLECNSFSVLQQTVQHQYSSTDCNSLLLECCGYAKRGGVYYCSLLPIGIVNVNSLKKGNKRLSKQEYLSIPLSFIAFLAGFIDGDGYIQITRTTKGYIQIKLEISLQLIDISTIEYIHSVLKLGKIYISKDIRYPRCRLIINKTDLQEILFPLFLHHKIFFLTETRKNQFNTAMYILNNNIKFFNEIPDIKYIPTVFELSDTVSGYLNLYYINNWIVGFTVAEGSFVIKNNGDHSFQLKQIIHTNLFNTFKYIFNTKRNIYIEKKIYNQFSISSKVDIQKVINFFSFSGLHPLVGLKNIQYLKWLESLNNSIKYNSLNIPNKK